MDVGLRPNPDGKILRSVIVSILVLVDVGLRPLIAYFFSEYIPVSILVLVDVSLRHVESAELMAEMMEFQSLF